MANSQHLHTTPGPFDFPPASSSASSPVRSRSSGPATPQSRARRPLLTGAAASSRAQPQTRGGQRPAQPRQYLRGPSQELEGIEGAVDRLEQQLLEANSSLDQPSFHVAWEHDSPRIYSSRYPSRHPQPLLEQIVHPATAPAQRIDNQSESHSIPPPAHSHSGAIHPTSSSQTLYNTHRQLQSSAFDHSNAIPRPSSSSARRRLYEASERLQQANSDLRLLLDQPIGRSVSSPTIATNTHRSHSALRRRAGRHESDRRFWYGLARPLPAESSRTWERQDRRRARSTSECSNGSSERDVPRDPTRKRPRLNDRVSTNKCIPSPLYGWDGQVVSTKLDLTLLNSNSGIVDCPFAGPSSTSSYGMENIIKDDHSVYCTKASKCNIILQHNHNLPFCLKSLVIKAASLEFTDCVQEGLVFVTMKNDRVLEWTAKYPVSYFPTCLFASYFPSLADTASSKDVYVEHASRQLIQGDQGPPNNTCHFDQHQSLGMVPLNSVEEPHRDLERRLESLVRQRPQPHLLGLGLGNTQQEEPNDLYEMTASISQRIRDIGESITHRTHSQPSSLTLRPPETRTAPFEHLIPAARFRMYQYADPDVQAYARLFENRLSDDTGSQKVKIEFDPPLSARYILLKLWSPKHDGIIGIENISAHGYVGPRFFPAAEKR